MRASPSNVLVSNFWQEHSLARDAVCVVAFSLLTALMAQLRIPLAFTPVPITGQTFAVLLSGAVLGARRAFLSQALYLVEGAFGLPVFAGGVGSFVHLVGPTGGYLLSYPAAAGLVGWLAELGASRKTWQLALALLLADGLILVSGTARLLAFYNLSYPQALALGFYPFLVGDTVKIALVGLSVPRLLKRQARPRPSAQG